MDRIILHVDCNKFYASVEARYHPELKNKPFAVGGDPNNRHGIILTKSEEAAKFGIKTGEPLWQAYQKCPDLTVIPPHFDLYESCAQETRDIYRHYTEQIEPFGLDEAWLDITRTAHLFGGGEQTAFEIKERIKNELGITVSIGVSFNKVFAKLGSDYKKPDAITVFSKENYKEKVWPLPLSSLLFIGQNSSQKLNNCFLKTIGDIARCNPKYLETLMGKQGKTLYIYANGFDKSAVQPMDLYIENKSISNSTTPAHDLETEESVKQNLFLLAEHISKRLAKKELKAKTIGLSVRKTDLTVYSRQFSLDHYTGLSTEIALTALQLFRKEKNFTLPVRNVGISVADFSKESNSQIDFLGKDQKMQKRLGAEAAVNRLKERFGDDCIRHALLLESDITKKHSTFGHCVFGHIQ